jgi:hypothetical protein
MVSGWELESAAVVWIGQPRHLEVLKHEKRGHDKLH